LSARCLSTSCTWQVSKVADLLAPVIETLDTQPSLADPVKTRGGPSGGVMCILSILSEAVGSGACQH
jgi:hypothetical protein